MDLSALSPPGGVPVSPTSPVSSGPKRKRSMIGVDSSPGSIVGVDDDQLDNDRRRPPGVKRACNECRQQKLRCDVVQDPFHSCSRCNRLRLDCKIESNFKRVGKRSRHNEMEKEIERLHHTIQKAQNQGYTLDDDDLRESPLPHSVYTHTRNPSLMGSEEAVSSLLHLKRSGVYNLPLVTYELETVHLTAECVSHLFDEFFTHYHPFLPFLNPQQVPDLYMQQNQLLFWSIVAIGSRRYHADGDLLSKVSAPLSRLLWTTIGSVPSSYYAVKALCLLCTWPLPTSTTSSDPTHVLCGVMMKIATGIGLHRPSHIQDFSRVAIDLNNEQLHDRVTTWATCNIVAQSVGTGYGQPASTLYDWTLAVRPGDNGPFALSKELKARLQIERFCDKISKEMYTNASDPRGVAGEEHRAMLTRVYRRELSELQASIVSQNHGRIVMMHLKAAALHLRLSGFFDSSRSSNYIDDLMGLWRALIVFLDEMLREVKDVPPQQSHRMHHLQHQQDILPSSHVLYYISNYLQQMLTAAGFALLKLAASFFSQTIDHDRAKDLFHRTVYAMRMTRVTSNDLQSRLAELMVQLWNGSKAQRKSPWNDKHPSDDIYPNPDESLQLKVRCRHSMSVVYDSAWRWRDDYLAQGRGSLDTESVLHSATIPDSTNVSSTSSTHLDGGSLNQPLGLAPSAILAHNGALAPGSAALAAATTNNMLALPYASEPTDTYDPQHWILNGLLDFNFFPSFAQVPMEGA